MTNSSEKSISLDDQSADRPNPHQPVNHRRFLFRLTGVVSGSMFLDGYVIGIIGTVIAAITVDFDLSLMEEGLLGASLVIGIFIGGPLGGWLADRLGRKPLFAIDLALFIASSALLFFVDSSWQLIALRILAGVAIGADYSVGYPLLTEFSPRKIRGILLSVTSVLFYVGVFAAYVVGYVMTSVFSVDWRYVLGSCLVPAVILFLARLGLPESPRWLMHKGRTEEASAVANQYFEDPSDILDINTEKLEKGSFAQLFSRQYIRSTVFLALYWTFNLMPYYVLATFAASIMAKYGLDDGLGGAVANSGVAVLGVIATVFLIERIGRRKLAITPQWICAAVLAVVALWMSAPPAIVLAAFLIFTFFNSVVGNLNAVFTGEVYPTEIRGIGTGFVVAFSRIGTASGLFVFPWAIDHFGISATMLVAVGICVAGAINAQLLAPETMGLKLSETSAPRV